MQIDIAKLKEAVTIQTEEEADDEEKKENQYKEVDASSEENDFLERRLKNFEVFTSKTGALEKKCMLNLMKVVGELAELRSKELIEKNQEQRLSFYEKDDKKYVMSCHGTLM